jgi:hypothetical protein
VPWSPKVTDDAVCLLVCRVLEDLNSAIVKIVVGKSVTCGGKGGMYVNDTPPKEQNQICCVVVRRLAYSLWW